MNDRIFEEISEQLRPDPEVRAALFAQIDPQPAAATPPPRRPGRRWAWVASVAVVAVVAGLIAAPMLTGRGLDHSDPPEIQGAAGRSGEGTAQVADDYSAIYAAVDKALLSAPQYLAVGQPFMPDAAVGLQSAGEGAWKTNRQVSSIDEGDVVKSDGKTIFTVAGRDVVLVSAAGRETAELSRIDTTAHAPSTAPDSVQGPIVDLMLHGSSLVVVATEYTPRLETLTKGTSLAYVPYEATQSSALIYDVSDPASPRFVTSFGQSGAFATSRLSGDTLYLLTEYTVTGATKPNADRPETFVPRLWDGRETSTVRAADCTLMPTTVGPRYSVISSIDLAEQRRVDTHTVLGGSSATYMSERNLYLASADQNLSPAEQAQLGKLGGLTTAIEATTITRIALDAGALGSPMTGMVPGRLLNQFSMDEFEGHLRVAVTWSGTSASGQWSTQPALFVLDESLRVSGSLPRLTSNESVTSVRFDGPVGYVVSFRQVDPLFTLDLADPASPTVMSELKIPGFSTYLHPFGAGRLLGVGVDADSRGMTTGLKLSMFDTSDPFKVTEAATIAVPYANAEALTNHKAVLVDEAAGLIGFAASSSRNSGGDEGRYMLYRFDGAEFSLLDRLPVQQGEAPADQLGVRGLIIGQDLYVASAGGVDVYRLGSLNKVGAAAFS